MAQEDKQLLLKDLCARLPYGVICNTPKGNGHLNSINQTIFGIELGININAVHRDTFKLEECKPYLRPMSSMTEEEEKEFGKIIGFNGEDENNWVRYDNIHTIYGISLLGINKLIDWLNAHHFDYCGLIERGLVIEATEDMYRKGK